MSDQNKEPVRGVAEDVSARTLQCQTCNSFFRSTKECPDVWHDELAINRSKLKPEPTPTNCGVQGCTLPICKRCGFCRRVHNKKGIGVSQINGVFCEGFAICDCFKHFQQVCDNCAKGLGGIASGKAAEPTPTENGYPQAEICQCGHPLMNHGPDGCVVCYCTRSFQPAEPTPVRTPASDVLNALIALRSFMWSEGYADQTPAMAQADAAIAASEDMEISLDGTSADAPVDPERQTSHHTADKA